MLTAQQRGLVASEFYATLWGNPNLETNLTVQPRLLTPARPVQIGYNLRNIELTLPGNVRYNVYSFGPFELEPLRGGNMEIGKWLPLSEFMDKHDTHLRLTYQDSVIVPKPSDCYIINLIGNGAFLLVPYEYTIKDKTLLATIRCGKFAHDSIIDSVETVLNGESARATLAAKIVNDPRRTLKEYIVDNRWLRTVTASDMTPTSSVLEIDDGSVLAVETFSMDALDAYGVNNVPYYLLDLAAVTPFEFLNYNDLKLFLVHNNEGYFVPHLSTRADNRPCAVQLGSHSYGILGQLIESIMDENGWTATDTELVVFIGKGGAQNYLGNINYQFNMATLSAEQRHSALVGSIDGPDAFKATTLHHNALNHLINQPKPVVDAYPGNIYPIAETDRIFNYGIVDADVVEHNFLNLSDQVKVAKAYKDGAVVASYPDNNPGDYDYYYMEHENDLVIHTGNVNQADLYNPVVYKADGTLGVEGTDYTILDGAILPGQGTYVVDMASSISIDLAMSSESAAVPNLEFYQACCHIDVFADDKLLHPGLDYGLANGRFYYYRPDSPTKVEFKATPKFTPAIIEQGFTQNGVISVNGNYLVEDPSSYYIWVGDTLHSPFDLDWEEDYYRTTPSLTNGVPYMVVKRLLNDYTGSAADIKTQREAHQENLAQISAYANLTPPDPITDPSYYTDQYKLRCWVLEEILREIIAGNIDYRKLTVQSRGLINVLSPHIRSYLDAKVDPALRNHPRDVVEIIPHLHDDIQYIPGDIYMFLETVNRELLGSAVEINQYYRIK